MKKEIAELWIQELESGFWEQGKYFLEHTNTYCVYGVLANIAATYGVCSHTGNNIGAFDDSRYLVPESVVKWAELKTPNGALAGFKLPLAEMNDNGKSFKQLAQIIRKHVDEL
jgi:hypothetical protein